MRKTVLSLCAVLLTIFSFNSCAKNSEKQTTPVVNKTLVNEVVQLESDRKAQKAAYNFLSAQEKYYLWKTQIEYCLSKGLPALQASQLQKIKDYLKPELFEVSDSASRQGISLLIGNAVASTDISLLASIVAEIHTAKFYDNYFQSVTFSARTAASSQKTASVDIVTDCGCSISSDYCGNTGVGYHCVTNVYNCLRQPNGCGSFWVFPCDGDCTL